MNNPEANKQCVLSAVNVEKDYGFVGGVPIEILKGVSLNAVSYTHLTPADE